MNLFKGTIRKKLFVTVLVASLPVYFVHLGTELYNRQKAIELAVKETSLLLSGFVEIQNRITSSTETLLRTVSSIPDISSLNEEGARTILETLLEANPIYTNAILVDIDGNVIAAGKNHNRAKGLNFADRKQFREAIASKGFASGEFVVGKSSKKSIFPFGMAVLDGEGRPAGAIIIGVNLIHYGELYEKGDYPLNSFLGITDHKGTRLFRYPSLETTGIGEPIKKNVFEAASSSTNNGSLRTLSSDGKERIVAFQSLRLNTSQEPYMYLFLGLDYTLLQQQANAIVVRLVLSSMLSLSVALLFAWLVGAKSISQLIEQLTKATRQFRKGELSVISDIDYDDGEIGELAKSFDSMVNMINKREDELTKHREKLESLVEERTGELKEAHEELVQSERLATLGKLTATVSHELRNPLGTIKNTLFSFEDCLKNKDCTHMTKPLQLADRSITRCVKIIEELNSYTRVKELDLSEVYVDEWLSSVVMEQTVPEEISCELDLNSGVRASFDQEKLRQVIVNLISNAIDALHEKPEGIKQLRISTHHIDHAYEIRIKDNGLGMSDDTLEKVFTPLFSTKNFGVGLGMVIVKNIVEQHHGEIRIESDQGTAVTLLLPVNSLDE